MASVLSHTVPISVAHLAVKALAVLPALPMLSGAVTSEVEGQRCGKRAPRAVEEGPRQVTKQVAAVRGLVAKEAVAHRTLQGGLFGVCPDVRLEVSKAACSVLAVRTLVRADLLMDSLNMFLEVPSVPKHPQTDKTLRRRCSVRRVRLGVCRQLGLLAELKAALLAGVSPSLRMCFLVHTQCVRIVSPVRVADSAHEHVYVPLVNTPQVTLGYLPLIAR